MIKSIFNMTFLTHCNDFYHVLFLPLQLVLHQDNMQKKKCSVIVLAGGKSERMKFPKAYLDMMGELFIEKIIRVYFEAGISDIIVVMNEQFCSGKWAKYFAKISSNIILVKNNQPELERFNSLKLGIQKMEHRNDCFIQPVDNPFIDVNILETLWNNKLIDGFVSPVFNGKGGHPVLLSNKIIKEINAIEENDKILKDVLNSFRRIEVEMENDHVLRNINTQEDYYNLVSDKIIL